MAVWIYLIIVILLIFWAYAKWEAGHFKRKGIKNLPYDFPLVGNMLNVLLLKEHITTAIRRVYNAFPNERYVGYKQMDKNLILVRDIELLKQIGIKDFDHFTDHLIAINENADDLFGKNLFSLTGEKWRDMRATLSPAFTSSKMRNMFQFIVEIGQQMSDYYVEQMKEPECKERGLVEVEMEEAFTRYANDVIATSAFGIKVNSLLDKDNIFYSMGKDASNFVGIRFVKFFLYTTFPKLAKTFGLQLFPNRVKQFFRELVIDTMKNREANKIVRHDMIHLLMEARKGSLKYETEHTENIDAGFATVEESHVGQKAVKRQWSDDDMVAQGLLFFMAGFATSANVLCLLVQELVSNEDIQRKLQAEIDEISSEKDFKLSYNDLIKMTYMDMVISETLRKWPPVGVTDRKCIKEYTLPPSSPENPNGCKILKGESIGIPVFAIHHDPEYFPNPEKFDPERFSEENKDKIKPFSYLPFGIGPRNCIGSRFALMEMKAVVFYLLKSFDIVRTAKTQIPLKLSTKTFNLVAENGFWVGLKPRC